MRRMALVCLVLGLCAASFGDIPVIGLNENGKEEVVRVPASKYAKAVAGMIEATREEALPVLDRMQDGRKWKLETVTLGIGLDVKLGLSPVFELGITPRFRAHISKNPSPVIP